jgi:uncharacterized membrane protein
MDPLLAVRAVHILGAVLWAGATFLLGAVVFPALRKTPGAEEAFVMAVLRRGGFGPFFTIVSSVTVLAGATLYVGEGYAAAPFASAASSLLSVAGGLAVLLVAYTALVIGPAERRAIRFVRALPAHPSAGQLEAFRAINQAMGRKIALGAPFLFVVLVLMLVRPLVG